MLVRQPRIQDSSACSDTCRVTDGGWGGGVNELNPSLPRTQKPLPRRLCLDLYLLSQTGKCYIHSHVKFKRRVGETTGRARLHETAATPPRPPVVEPRTDISFPPVFMSRTIVWR